MDNSAGALPPRTSKSPTREAGNTVQGFGIPGPAAVTEERSLSSHHIAVVVDNLAPTSNNSTAIGNSVAMDIIMRDA